MKESCRIQTAGAALRGEAYCRCPLEVARISVLFNEGRLKYSGMSPLS